MKKGLLLFLLLLLTVIVGSVYAIDDPSAGPQAMAQYFPEETAGFFAFRTDSAYIDELDSIIERTIDGLPDVPAVSLRDTLEEALNSEGTSLDEVYAWLGDNAAIGVADGTGLIVRADPEGEAPSAPSGNDIYFVVQITDRAAAEAFIDDVLPLPDSYEKSTEGDFTLYASDETEGVIALNDEVLLIGLDVALLDEFPPETRLTDNADFNAVIQDMPAPSYNIFFYTSAEVYEGVDAPAMFIPSASGIGFAYLDDRALVIDVVGLRELGGVEPVDPEFRRFIPGDSSGVIHATNLAGVYEGLLTAARATGVSDEDPGEQIERTFGFLGIDLEEDFLSWATGDYAIFGRVDISALFKGVIDGELDLTTHLDFGVVIEATDPVAADLFATKLGTILKRLAEEAQDVTVTDALIGDTDITLITLSGEASGMGEIEYEIAIGATDEVFFIASRPAAEVIVNASGDLANNPTFNEAGAYLLPDAVTVMYADTNGLLISTIVPLALLGPSIGNIFNNVTENLESSTLPALPNTLSVASQGSSDVEQIQRLLDWFDDTFSSGSISAAVSEGSTQVRAVLTYREG